MSSSQSNERLLVLFQPSPCPFCGMSLIMEFDDEGMFYMHPTNECIMASVILEDIDDVKLWQKRVVGQHPEVSEK